MNLKSNMDPRMKFGFLLLFVIGLLSGRIALGHVRQEDSYGLEIVLGSLATLAGAFGQWAFSGKVRDDKDKDDKES